MPRILRSLTIVGFVFGLVAGVLLVGATAAFAVTFETERPFADNTRQSDPKMQFGLQPAATVTADTDAGYQLWGQEKMDVGPFSFNEVEVRDGRLKLHW
jgi:hypothetical protein